MDSNKSNKENASSGGPRPKRRGRRRRSQGKSKRTQADSQRSSGNTNKRDSRSARGARNRPKRRPSLKDRPIEEVPVSKIVELYDQLQSDYQKARKRYFENSYKDRSDHKGRTYDQAISALKKIRELEAKVNGKQREALERKTNGLPLDTTYSNNHQLGVEGDLPPSGPYKRQHVKDEQLNRSSYARDEEETHGSMEDYNAYKSASSAP